MTSYKQNQQDIINHFHKIKAELGRVPTVDEFCNSIVGGRRLLWQHFRNWDKLLAAVGVSPSQTTIEPAPMPYKESLDPGNSEKLLRQYKKICSTVQKMDSFNIHTLDLKELFRKAGNPPTLKLSGQPDTHVKFMDIPAVRSYKKFLNYYRPDVHLIFGDFVDCEGVSHWPAKDMEPRRLIPELVQARKLLEEICAVTPTTTTRVYCEGNHEDWINQAFTRMPEFFDGIHEFLGIDLSVSALLNLEKYGYQLFPVNDLVQIGNAHFTHGIYTPKHHAQKHLEVFKCNIYYGHLHDAQSATSPSIYGVLEAASNGCLSKLDAKFMKGKPNGWVHGHAIWEIFPDGSFTRCFIPIKDGRCSFNGHVFDGNVE